MKLPDGGLAAAGSPVRLEPLRVDHAEALLEISRMDAGMWRFLVSAEPRTVEEMRRYVGVAVGNRAAGTECPFAVVDAGSGAVLGSTRFMDVQPVNRSLEIGVTFYAPAARRTAVNTWCKLMMLSDAFDRMGCERVQLKCDTRNGPSRAAIARLGATFEGVLRKHRVLPDGYVRDTAYYSIVAAEWPDVRVRLESMVAAGKDGQAWNPR